MYTGICPGYVPFTRKQYIIDASLIINGGGGFFLACEEFGRRFDKLFSASAFFFFFFEIEISSRTLNPIFRQDKSTVAQRAEMTVTECSLTSCV